MNILIYMTTSLIGGVRTVTEILYEELSKKGNSVYILMLKRAYGDDRDLIADTKSIYFPSDQLSDNINYCFFKRLVNEIKIDIIINQTGLYTESLSFFNNMCDLNIPIISVLHNNPYHEYKWVFKDAITLRNSSNIEKLKRIARIVLYFRTKYRIKKNLYNLFELIHIGGSHVCVLSPSYIDYVKEINPNIKNITAIANPNTYIDPQIKKKEKIVLFVGRLDNRSKKIQYLLDIWKDISNKSTDWKLILVGDGKDRLMIEDKISKMHNVELHGYQNPTPYYERASILCMTSMFEGFPMALTEAMQHGCVPIVFDSFPAVYDMINNGKDGEIVPAFKSGEYKKKLLKLMLDNNYLCKLSAAARNNVCRFDRKEIVEQWETLFNKLR